MLGRGGPRLCFWDLVLISGLLRDHMRPQEEAARDLELLASGDTESCFKVSSRNLAQALWGSAGDTHHLQDKVTKVCDVACTVPLGLVKVVSPSVAL